MTTTLPRPVEDRRRLHLAADIVLAIVLFAVDAIVSLIALYRGMDAAGYAFFDTGADHTHVSMTKPAVHVVVAGLVVLVTALFAYKGRAFVTACVQALVGLLLILGAAVGLVGQYREDHPPAPEPGYSGPQSQCLSGGDDSECHGS
ncbi:hypothetical protein GCM10020367_62650 [Streptomyces sannanensis]|uniref:DUF6234 domain-containing protein n=1 Tax=Streptomyces sannanensis TaxID=285536 RepID=A0ABP6SLG1_9ACTN